MDYDRVTKEVNPMIDTKKLLLKIEPLISKIIQFTAVFLALFMTATIIPTTAALARSPWNAPTNFSELAGNVSPVVVNIRTVKTTKGSGRVLRHFFQNPRGQQGPHQDFFDKFFGNDAPREFKQRSLGSGFIIEQDGYIVTNNHVVEDADEIQVLLKDGSEYDATIVGRDPNTDLALIKIDPDKTLSVATLGDSGTLTVGEWVVAIGSPFGLEQTVTAGIISAKGRVIGSGPYDDFLQTDASINPGNSGGPLINMGGEVIGINTAIVASGQGIGFAIPINMAKGIINQLKSSGEVTRGWLGVYIQNLNDELAEYYGAKDKKGVLVAEVVPGDPAEKAGIMSKDIIYQVNGKPVTEVRELTRLVAEIPVGDKAEVKVLREGKTKIFKVKIAKRKEKQLAKKDAEESLENDIGVRVTEITPEMVRRYNIPAKEGLIVMELSPDGKGKEAGLEVGDVIKEINHKEVKSLEDYDKAMSKVDKGDPISIFIQRKNVGYQVIKITR
jgi:serine protease Do